MEQVVAPQLGRLPPALKNRPVQYEDLDYVYAGFNVLTRSRRPKEPLTVSDIVAYAEVMCIADMEAFIILIQAADEAYLKYGHKTRHNS